MTQVWYQTLAILFFLLELPSLKFLLSLNEQDEIFVWSTAPTRSTRSTCSKVALRGQGGNLWVSQFSLHLLEASVSLPSHQPKVHLSFRTVRKPVFFWILPLFLQENQKELSFAFLTSKF